MKPLIRYAIDITTAAALTLVLFIIAISVPIIKVLAIVLTPMPVIMLLLRHRMNAGVMAVALTGLLVAATAGLKLGILYLCDDGVLSILVGVAIKSGLKPLKLLIVGTASQIISLILVLFINSAEAGKDIISYLDYLLSAFRNLFMETFQQRQLYIQKGCSENDLGQLQLAFEQIIDFSIKVFPMVIIIICIIKIYLLIKVVHRILRNHDFGESDLAPVKYWDIYKGVVHFFLWSLVIIYMGVTREISWMQIAGYNLCIITSGALFLQGLAVFNYLADKYSLSKIVRSIILVIVIFYPFAAIIVCSITGVSDLFFNYRQLERRNR